MRVWLILLILACMAILLNGASFNQFKHYGSVHGHNHGTNGEPFRPENSTKMSFSDFEEYDDRWIEMEEEVPNYPYQEVRHYLRNNPLLRDYFVPPEIRNRDSIAYDVPQVGESLCRTRGYRRFYPQKLKNENNIWRTIVNIRNEYEQGVEIKSCASEGTCSKLESANIPFGFTSFCAQEFISKELMVYNSTTAFDLFRFPSCCVCKLKRT